MAKPTLFQTILGRPSQAYHHPPNKDYFSTKQELVRAATEATARAGNSSASVLGPGAVYQPPSAPSASPTPSNTRPASPRHRPTRDPEPTAPHLSRKNSAASRHSKSRPLSQSISTNSNTDHQTEPTLFTPSTPPTSLSGETTPTFSPLSSLHRQSTSSEDHSSKPPSASNGHEGDNEASIGEESSSDDDVFYTPRSSLYSSPRTSRASAGSMLIDPKALTSALLPLPSSPFSRSHSSIHSKSSSDYLSPHGINADGLPISRTPSESSFSSSSYSSSSSTEDTVRTNSTPTNTTRLTTPVTSDYGERSAANKVKTITIASSSSRSPPLDPQPGPIRGQPRPLALTSTRRGRSKTEQRKLTYTDEDWAKDVRWLAPVDPSKSSSPRKLPRTLPPDIVIPDLPPPTTTVAASRLLPRQPGQRSYPPPSPSAEHRRRSRRSKGSRSSRGRMSALLEEDESEYSDQTLTSSSAEPSRAPSPVLEEHSETRANSVPLPSSPLGVSVVRSASYRSKETTSTSDEAGETPDARVLAYAQNGGQPKRSYSNTRRLSRSLSPTMVAYTQTLTTHPIPAPVPDTESSNGTHGYTSLTLPRAAYLGDGKADLGDGKVDLVRAGLAQSSMATVEVTRGVAQLHTPSDFRRKRRTLSFSFSLKFLEVKGLGKVKGKGKQSITPAHLLDTLPLPVEFTAHLPPPTYIPSQHVLVQVFAVGLDSLDSLLVHEKAGTNGKGAGFIPGRSIVGKVIDMGWEVKEDVCKKGEWVVGLLDVRKSGALAEFIVVERHRIHRAPQPASRPTTLLSTGRRTHIRSMSLPTQLNQHPYAQIHRDLLASSSFTVEELALLPLCALPAHRAIRTFQDVIAPAKPRQSDPSLARRPRIFVLQGHDGPGAIAVQILARRGVRVCVQVPDSAARDDTNEGDDEDEEDDPITIQRGGSPSHGAGGARVKQTRYDKLDARLRAWGAEEICVGEPLEILERFVEEGRSFDAVLDTVGGVEVWEQSRRILLADPDRDSTSRPSPETPVSPSSAAGSSSKSRASSNSNKRTFQLTQFTTLVGDIPSRPIPNTQDNFRTGFRSLKRTMSTSTSRSRSRSPSKSSTSLLASSSKDSLGLLRKNSTSSKAKTPKRTVSYAWVCAAQDVDFGGEDVRDSLSAAISMAEEGWFRPWIGDETDGMKLVPFDKAPEMFRRDADGPIGLLRDGGTCVVRVVG